MPSSAVTPVPARRPRARRPRGQRGAFLVTAALSLLFLLGFMGLAVDFGRLFVTKSELQTALDSCALAAAQELDGKSDALNRARQAGLTAANLHQVHFQNQGAGLVAADIEFSDRLTTGYAANPTGAVRYVRCKRTVSGLAPLLLQAFDAFGADGFSQPQRVGGLAVATLAPTQTNCLIPVGVCQRPGGYQAGEWIQGVTNDQEDMEAAGQFRWLNLGETGGTRGIKDLLAGNGQCGLPGLDTRVSKSGKSNGAVEGWNSRFGLYVGEYNAAAHSPDTTGYAWYVDGDTVSDSMKGRYSASNGYAFHQNLNSAYQGNNKTHTERLNARGGNNPSTKAVHEAGTRNRRVITVAEINCDGAPIQIQGFACMFMLHPMEKAANGRKTKMWLEYIGDATAASGNPCVTYGLPGGGNGPRSPALVQ